MATQLSSPNNRCEYTPPTPPSSEGAALLVQSRNPLPEERLTLWRADILKWLAASRGDQRHQLRLEGVDSRALLEAVWNILLELGRKPKCEWLALSRTLILTMRSRTHQLVWASLSRFDDLVQAHLQQVGVALCGVPGVANIGSASIELSNGIKDPDGSLRVTISHGANRVLAHGGTPVVFETAFSQSLASARRKACEYLYYSGDNIRVALVCNMTYPLPETRCFRAEIEVWVRGTPNDPGAHQLNPCQFLTDQEAASHAQPQATADQWHDGRLEAGGPTFQDQDSDGTHSIIHRRNALPIVILDEELAIQPVDPVLRLHVYDFILPCTRFPQGRVPEELQWINLPLGWLQEKLVDELAVHRAGPAWCHGVSLGTDNHQST
ncbi:hypothetical protein FRC08_003905 [Ceratobasidium sp. 394]|nr:hypothetical protein FRC08_003905 [Ceratobasidium sp. 394]